MRFAHVLAAPALLLLTAGSATAAFRAPDLAPVSVAEVDPFVRVVDVDRNGVLSEGDLLRSPGGRTTVIGRRNLIDGETLEAVLGDVRGARVMVLSFSGRRYIATGGIRTKAGRQLPGGVSLRHANGKVVHAPLHVVASSCDPARTSADDQALLHQAVQRLENSEAELLAVLRRPEGKPWRARFVVARHVRRYEEVRDSVRSCDG